MQLNPGYLLTSSLLYISVSFKGSGRKWVNHLIEMATGFQTSGLTNDGSFILISDHFLDDHSFFKKTNKGLKSKLKLESLPKSTRIDIQKFQQHQ